MAHESTPEFRTFHALRVKGFADTPTLADMTGHEHSTVEEHLGGFSGDGHVKFREARSLWQLTPEGREAHGNLLESDLGDVDAEAELAEHYPEFVECNVAFKELCGDWQLRDGQPNDHSDAEYDQQVIDRLAELHERSRPIVAGMGERFQRLAPYLGRLDAALAAVQGGDTSKFTGVMCGSYHDVWMELHEDLIVTQGIDREAEGSF